EIASILDGIPLSVQRRFPELENRHVDFLKRDIIKAMNKAAAPGFAHCSGRSHRPPLNGRMPITISQKNPHTRKGAGKHCPFSGPS
ncbi:terminase small subunit, partial [Escherichia coli]|uniref:terminase small subunit n=1 Tax=Escherichia coli TaxID=562 RepID=UPI002033A0B1